ncbi:DNA-binding protein [Azospirillum sp. A26]|uniref:DNA-binding protein n=1 Tax=Azospirillum sp. A26 TaxID=3160607 RepID=UPI00366DBC01
MSATKATRAAVQAAYDALRAEGVEPTAEQVLQRTGGSKTTVCRHLHEIAAASPPSATLSVPSSAPPSDDAPVELPLEWREASDGLTRTFAHILTRTIAAERERAMQLLEAEASARGAAVAAMRAEAETLRQGWEKSRKQAEADFAIAASEVEALQEIVTTLLVAVDLETSDDLDDLRAIADRAIDRIRELTAAAARVPALEADLEQRMAEFRTVEGRVEELREAAGRAERKCEELTRIAARVPALEAAAQASEFRIAELSAAAAAGAEAIGRAKALEQVVDRLTVAPHAAVPKASAPSRNGARSPKHSTGKATGAGHVVKDVDNSPTSEETTSADQPLPFADLVLAAPPPIDGESPRPPTSPVPPT